MYADALAGDGLIYVNSFGNVQIDGRTRRIYACRYEHKNGDGQPDDIFPSYGIPVFHQPGEHYGKNDNNGGKKICLENISDHRTFSLP